MHSRAGRELERVDEVKLLRHFDTPHYFRVLPRTSTGVLLLNYRVHQSL